VSIGNVRGISTSSARLDDRIESDGLFCMRVETRFDLWNYPTVAAESSQQASATMPWPVRNTAITPIVGGAHMSQRHKGVQVIPVQRGQHPARDPNRHVDGEVGSHQGSDV